MPAIQLPEFTIVVSSFDAVKDRILK